MDEYEFNCYVKAGNIARQVKEYARGMIRPGMKLIDVAEAIDSKILELGGDYAFPVGLGIDEVAAHFTPGPDSEEVVKGLLKVDIGVSVEGFIGDTAFSLDFSEGEKFGKLIDFNEGVLKAATEKILEGGELKVKDIGEAVSEFVEETGMDEFVVVKGLCGHSLGQNTVHSSPTIPNYKNNNGFVLSEGAFAVEPFVSTGNGEIIEGKDGGIYILKDKGVVRDADARKLVGWIRERFEGRPFCLRWIFREIREGDFEFDEKKLRMSLRMLVRAGVVYEYPILLEKSRKAVSQMENTFLVANGKVVCTTG